MATPLPMPDEAPVTRAFWPKSFRSMGQAGITTGGSVSSLASPAVFTSIVRAPHVSCCAFERLRRPVTFAAAKGSLYPVQKGNAGRLSFPYLAAIDWASRIARAIAASYRIHAPRALAIGSGPHGFAALRYSRRPRKLSGGGPDSVRSPRGRARNACSHDRTRSLEEDCPSQNLIARSRIAPAPTSRSAAPESHVSRRGASR